MHGVTCGDSLTYLPHIGTMHIHLPTLIHCKWDNPALAFITVCTSMCNSHISEDSVTRFLISNSSTPRECAIFRPLPVSANTQQQPQAWHAWNMVHKTQCTCMHISVYPKHTNVLASHSWQRRRNYTMSHLQVSLPWPATLPTIMLPYFFVIYHNIKASMVASCKAQTHR